eukprot:TRINITY_DN5329_c0_g1_i1.p1 TRINITY_DN5329_c0_g1~~TRINITY_DN5329_c0_g1_i1.p1  ORF type:complete len:306 (-),score=54.61 TRINITY_DN5329_c0_g1_i1:629-1546(-)
MDCAIVPLPRLGLFLIETTDFFYPLVNDPYAQGRIACANVLSDLYSMGIEHCDNMLMLIAASTDMTAEQRDVVTTEMMRGFNDLAREAGTHVTGGQSVLNPWPIIGGVATAVLREEEFIRPENAVVGDVLILTKALGTQVAVNAHQWLSRPANWSKVSSVISVEEAKHAFHLASDSMSRLNRNAAKLMRKYGAHGATDVTGFGILGHARNLASNQHAPVDFVIDVLPVIKGMPRVNAIVNFKLVTGFSAETSGGLLIALPAESADQFIRELQQLDDRPAWIIGRVVHGSRTASLAPDVQILEVDW